MRKLLTAGIFGTILGIVGAGTANASIVSSGFLDEKLTEMTNATTLQLDNKANQSDLVNLSNIVGTPMELTYRNILRNSDYIYNIMGSVYYDTYGDNTVPTNDISELINLNYTDTNFPGLAGVVQSLFEQRDRDDMWPLRLNDIFNDYDILYNNGFYSFMSLIISGGRLSSSGVAVYGLKDLTTKVDTNTAKIGTLPSGDLLENHIYSSNGSLRFWPKILLKKAQNNSTPVYPNNLAELINQIYGSSEFPGLIQAIYSGIETEGGDQVPNVVDAFHKAKDNTAKIGTVPSGKNLAGMISETDAKIGTLPAGYDSIGAALTAIKGIAEDAKAAALAAIPDPKQEGSSGKFVLTVDIVGDNATYRWEKIDREGETTTE